MHGCVRDEGCILITNENTPSMTRIETEKQYQDMMTRIEELLQLVTEDTPEDDVHAVELVRLSNLVADYDDAHYSMTASQ